MEINVLLALSTDANDFQRAQQASARQAATRLKINLQIIHADNDPIVQSQQLLTAIQKSSVRPEAVLVQPAGSTELMQVAQAAVSAGIGWAILNREPVYITDLRKTAKAPVFAVTSNQKEIGRIQGRQLASLLPNGGRVLYLQGPGGTSAAQLRAQGMNETKPENISVLVLKCLNWTREAGYKAVQTWLRLATSKLEKIDAVAAQNDPFAMGALQAVQEQIVGDQRERWSGVHFLGVDGLREEGQARVRDGLMAATVIVPPNAGLAMDLMVNALRGGAIPPDVTYTVPESFPTIDSLPLFVSRLQGTSTAR